MKEKVDKELAATEDVFGLKRNSMLKSVIRQVGRCALICPDLSLVITIKAPFRRPLVNKDSRLTDTLCQEGNYSCYPRRLMPSIELSLFCPSMNRTFPLYFDILNVVSDKDSVGNNALCFSFVFNDFGDRLCSNTSFICHPELRRFDTKKKGVVSVEGYELYDDFGLVAQLIGIRNGSSASTTQVTDVFKADSQVSIIAAVIAELRAYCCDTFRFNDIIIKVID